MTAADPQLRLRCATLAVTACPCPCLCDHSGKHTANQIQHCMGGPWRTAGPPPAGCSAWKATASVFSFSRGIRENNCISLGFSHGFSCTGHIASACGAALAVRRSGPLAFVPATMAANCDIARCVSPGGPQSAMDIELPHMTFAMASQRLPHMTYAMASKWLLHHG